MSERPAYFSNISTLRAIEQPNKFARGFVFGMLFSLVLWALGACLWALFG